MRLSRGRSTPTRRAIGVPYLLRTVVSVVSRPNLPRVGPGHCSGGVFSRQPDHSDWRPSDHDDCSVVVRDLTLALLVTRVVADHHDAAVATDHLALVTDLLDARVDLHEEVLSIFSAARLTCTGRRCDLG